MLWYYDRVIQSDDDLKLTLQVFSLGQKRGLSIAFWIGLWGIHVTFSIHNLIPFPVNYWSTSHCYLEDIRIIGDKRDCHETAKGPSVYADTVLINVWKRLKILHTFHLILHFLLSKMAESCLFESLSTVITASVVQYKE